MSFRQSVHLIHNTLHTHLHRLSYAHALYLDQVWPRKGTWMCMTSGTDPLLLIPTPTDIRPKSLFKVHDPSKDLATQPNSVGYGKDTHLLTPLRHFRVVLQLQSIYHFLTMFHKSNKLVTCPIIDKLLERFLSLCRAGNRDGMGLGERPRFKICLRMSSFHHSSERETGLLHSPQ